MVGNKLLAVKLMYNKQMLVYDAHLKLKIGAGTTVQLVGSCPTWV